MVANPRDKIVAYVRELLAEHDDHAPFGAAESLIRSGRLDSLAVVRLVSFLEGEFAVDFTRVEFDPQRLDSVNEIVEIVNEAHGNR